MVDDHDDDNDDDDDEINVHHMLNMLSKPKNDASPKSINNTSSNNNSMSMSFFTSPNPNSNSNSNSNNNSNSKNSIANLLSTTYSHPDDAAEAPTMSPSDDENNEEMSDDEFQSPSAPGHALTSLILNSPTGGKPMPFNKFNLNTIGMLKSSSCSNIAPKSCAYLKCCICAYGPPPSFFSSAPTWADICYIALYCLTLSKPEIKYFHIKKDICTFIDAHYETMCMRKRTSIWRQTVNMTLSHPQYFEMFQQESALENGRKGYYGLKQMHDPYEHTALNKRSRRKRRHEQKQIQEELKKSSSFQVSPTHIGGGGGSPASQIAKSITSAPSFPHTSQSPQLLQSQFKYSHNFMDGSEMMYGGCQGASHSTGDLLQYRRTSLTQTVPSQAPSPQQMVLPMLQSPKPGMVPSSSSSGQSHARPMLADILNSEDELPSSAISSAASSRRTSSASTLSSSFSRGNGFDCKSPTPVVPSMPATPQQYNKYMSIKNYSTTNTNANSNSNAIQSPTLLDNDIQLQQQQSHPNSSNLSATNTPSPSTIRKQQFNSRTILPKLDDEDEDMMENEGEVPRMSTNSNSKSPMTKLVLEKNVLSPVNLSTSCAPRSASSSPADSPADLTPQTYPQSSTSGIMALATLPMVADEDYSDDDDDDEDSPKKRMRKTTRPEEKLMLERYYQLHYGRTAKHCKEELAILSSTLGWKVNRIQRWLDNRRTKDKLKNLRASQERGCVFGVVAPFPSNTTLTPSSSSSQIPVVPNKDRTSPIHFQLLHHQQPQSNVITQQQTSSFINCASASGNSKNPFHTSNGSRPLLQHSLSSSSINSLLN
ncbi:hypothetical protein SAMD00019534_117720 [Acytostelium subglobosum LB1]|uniref:hypothetical protein n=1 Tax=Acytostelium subglobosum LB1 TaxID=1410327 RepID=UPI000644DE48|nr:hypothetical protein SAMD00019534_117720 [Acytostelium subglobosum LB1]GAM28596.1 hypothetical protein SAMD00019534_117720 [Acytostelium subglobosum LB1]|eukprot:XP_012748374.1 hypothetical protein SAMD00019534_117720 [Acytostelium subglobosum LB1]